MVELLEKQRAHFKALTEMSQTAVDGLPACNQHTKESNRLLATALSLLSADTLCEGHGLLLRDRR